MKVRTGFVSNSSSSSFILKDKKITTAQVASIMLYGVRESRIEYDKVHNDAIKCGDTHITCMNLAINWLEQHQEFDEPVSFPWTTNYETFIWRNEKNKICVSTCNNQQEYWGMLGELYDISYEESFCEGIESEEFLDLDSMQKFTQRGYLQYRTEQWQQLLQKKS